ncbi:MAG: ATPase domain-containing protein [Nanoarchaeota archaeon]|mgnify:CR=1 FL=1
MVDRIPSGIHGLDPLVEGGFKPGSVNLVCGGAGSGKTTFAVQFLIEGIARGEAGIYMTFEEKKEKLYDDMLTFGWDLEKFERAGLFKFLEYTPEQIKRVLVEGGGTIDAIITQLKAKRLVIDSITSFALLFQDELTQKESSLALFELINRWGCSAVLTSQAIQLSPDDLTAQLQFEVDSIIILYHFKKKGIRTRAIEILKMRGTKTPEKTMKLIIDKRGLTIDPAEVVTT